MPDHGNHKINETFDMDDEFIEDEGFACEYCEDDGMDPLNDYCLPCPYCNPVLRAKP